MIPRSPGNVSMGSRQYQEWQTIAFEATTEKEGEALPEEDGPLVEHPSYPTLTHILKRPQKDIAKTTMETEEANLEGTTPI